MATNAGTSIPLDDAIKLIIENITTEYSREISDGIGMSEPPLKPNNELDAITNV